MAQRHLTPTLPKSNSATNVSTLDLESPPKNDVSSRKRLSCLAM
ncbi:hypothetical protein P7M41_12345 [Vibrio parahaemolyticus]|nr:hypothetical protein [Vibrio parahaemolyticus]MDF4368857.1 hypothetical protein [Vibrio parahaemolyticus]MDF4559906.1 hypothetical protein [Vibrio parahaemolyticus]MDF4563054.1 hypothetical protein [Vibrio parahaemolyticus]MDF4762578.1 hypothetical protein [Vibrio parahaemolyticus]